MTLKFVILVGKSVWCDLTLNALNTWEKSYMSLVGMTWSGKIGKSCGKHTVVELWIKATSSNFSRKDE